MFKDDLIEDGSLSDDDAGFSFGARLNWYRALPLSSIGLRIAVDGEPVDGEDVTFTVDGETYRHDELPARDDRMWFVADTAARSGSTRPGGLAPGQHELMLLDLEPDSVHPDARARRAGAGGHVHQSRDGLMAPKLGTTLYSLTPEFHSRRYDVVGLIDEVGRRGLGPGLEIVGFQSIKGFPRGVSGVRARVQGARSSATGCSRRASARTSTSAARVGEYMSEDELVEYMEPQLEAAATLGFPVVRMQSAAGPTVIERLVPIAERLGVTHGNGDPRTADRRTTP